MFVWTILGCGFGYYGKDCIHRCSVKCNVTHYCNKSTGQCIGGCKPGWTGFMCDQGKYIYICFDYVLCLLKTYFAVTKGYFIMKQNTA